MRAGGTIRECAVETVAQSLDGGCVLQYTARRFAPDGRENG
jgi:hypothetical protein